jgi:hypothetical protein
MSKIWMSWQEAKDRGLPVADPPFPGTGGTPFIMELKHSNMQKTLGQKRVRIDFNPSADDAVGQIKKGAADLIDQVFNLPTPDGMHPQDVSEFMRYKALAMTDIETAAMYAVKAATLKPEPALAGAVQG